MVTDIDKIEILKALENDKTDGVNAHTLFFHKLTYEKGYNLPDLMRELGYFVKDGIVDIRGNEYANYVSSDQEILLISTKGLVVLKQLIEIENQKIKEYILQDTMTEISKRSLQLSSQMVKTNLWIAFAALVAAAYYSIEIGKFFGWWGK